MSKWQRALCCLLCLCVCFSSVVSPALAAESDPTPEVTVIEPVEVLEEQGIMVTSAAAGALVLAGGTGTVAVAPALLPIIGAIAGAGIVGYGLVQIVQLSQEFFQLLPVAVQLILEEWGASGEDTFTLDQQTASAFQTAFNDLFFNDDGTFVALTGLSFSAADLLAYNPDFLVHGSSYPSDVYQFDIGFNSATALGDTGLTAQLVESPGITGSDYGLKLVNTLTGVTCIYGISSLDTEYISSASSFKISPSVVRTRVDELTGTTLYSVGWFLLSHLGDAGPWDYLGTFVGDKGSSIIIQNLVNYDYNGLVTNVHLTSTGATWSAGDDTFQDACTPGMYLVGTAGAITQDEDIYKPYIPGGTIYTPTDAQAGDMDNTYDGTYANTGAVAGTDTEVGWLEKIWNAIKAIPGEIVQAIEKVGAKLDTLLSSFVSWIEEGVLNALKKAFIPSEGFFDNFFSNLQNTFSDRMGLLTYPISVLYNLCDRLLSLDDVEPVLSWKSWSYQGTEFIPAGSYNLNDICEENDMFDTLHDIYYVVVDAIMIFGLLHFLGKKYKSVISN